jgi:Ca2+-binding EF-hand superfamily protein
LLDDDGDGALTIKEIKDGMANCKIELKQEEWDLFYKTIDANSDGVLTCEEWV